MSQVRGPGSGRGSLPPFGPLLASFRVFSLRYPAARAVCGDGAAVRETDSLQFALYFQPGSEAAGREDKVLQRRGEQRLRLRHENHVILQIDIVCEMWFLLPEHIDARCFMSFSL